MIRKILLIPAIVAIFLAAVLITLVALHVVTVGGIYAFSSLKAREIAGQPASTPAAPVKPAVQPAAPETRPAANPAPDAAAFYTVVKGDSPVAIAKKLHVTADELQKLNNITDPKKLRIGQRLRIPSKNEPMPQTQS